MTGRATSQAVVRTCSREGCCRPVRARGMCATHYTTWTRHNPDFMRSQSLTMKTILDVLPATKGEIRSTTGMCYQTIARTLELMCSGDERRAHIGAWQFPISKGKKYEAIYHAGPGRDKALTDNQRYQHSRMQERDGHRRRKNARDMAAMVARSAGVGWTATLMVSAA